MSSTFPPDELDELASSAPIGVHRRPTSPWRAVIPFIVIIIVVPLAAWAIVWMVQNVGGSSDGEQSSTLVTTQSEDTEVDAGADESVVDDADADADADANTGDSQTSDNSADSSNSTDGDDEDDQTTVEEAPSVEYGTTVQVLNNTSITGYAASQASILQEAGFTNVTAGNATNWMATVSAVYYASEDLEATAQAIGEALGISAVYLNSTDVASGVVVILCS